MTNPNLFHRTDMQYTISACCVKIWTKNATFLAYAQSDTTAKQLSNLSQWLSLFFVCTVLSVNFKKVNLDFPCDLGSRIYGINP